MGDDLKDRLIGISSQVTEGKERGGPKRRQTDN
jgi:hypothetical protein